MRTLILTLLLTTQLATTASAKNRYIPAAGLSPGANGTFWRTDVRIYNPSHVEAIDVTLHFLPQGMDGRNIPGRMFTIGKRETLVLDNVVATLAPELTSAIGAIRIASHTDRSYEFIASSRTYTDSRDAARPGTFGQFVPALDVSDATLRAAVLHVTIRPEFRTNAGVMNPTQETAIVKLRLVGIDGKPFLESAVLEVPPQSMRQWSADDLFGGVYMTDGVIVVESTAPAFAWGSVIDNYSGDAIFVRGVDEMDIAPALAH